MHYKHKFATLPSIHVDIFEDNCPTTNAGPRYIKITALLIAIEEIEYQEKIFQTI